MKMETWCLGWGNGEGGGGLPERRDVRALLMLMLIAASLAERPSVEWLALAANFHVISPLAQLLAQNTRPVCVHVAISLSKNVLHKTCLHSASHSLLFCFFSLHDIDDTAELGSDSSHFLSILRRLKETEQTWWAELWCALDGLNHILQ